MSTSVSGLLNSSTLWRAVVAALVIGGRLYAERFIPRGHVHHRGSHRRSR